MALQDATYSSEAPGASTGNAGRTIVSPHPSDEGVFILRRGELLSTVEQRFTRIGGATIKYTLERPENITDPAPLVLVPGYGGIKPAYRELRKAVVLNGKPAATFKPPRTQERLAAFHPKHFQHPERLLAQTVIAISDDLIGSNGKTNEYDQVDAAGHSMGGPAIINAALVHPEYFRTVTAVASAGLDGHSLWDMARRSPGVVKEEIIPSLNDIQVRKDFRAVRDIMHYMARNPWRTLAEGLAVGSGDIRDKVSMLGALGVHTAALQFANDRFFPVDGVREHSANRFELFRVFPDPDANHMWPQLKPIAVANELVDIVNTLAPDSRA